jgi:hypothetical protein
MYDITFDRHAGDDINNNNNNNNNNNKQYPQEEDGLGTNDIL